MSISGAQPRGVARVSSGAMVAKESEGAGRAVTLGVLAAVLVAVAAVFAGALGGELVYDDLLLVARNPALGGFEQLGESLGRPHWDFVEPDQALRVGYWRPLALVALFVGRALGDGEPWGFHALSLALHLGSVALVFALVRTTLAHASLFVPAAAALLFGLHPVHVESVAWISAINDPLAGFWLFASLLLFARWRRAGSPGLALLPAVALLAALASKESALAWFALAPALDWTLGGEGKPRWRAYLPALVALAAYWLARTLVFDSSAAGFDLVTSHLRETALRAFTLRVELLGGALALLAWPLRLNLFREVRPEIPWDDAQLWIAVAALVAWVIALRSAWKRGARAVVLALTIALGGIAPAVLRIESIGRFPLSERFLYVSALGVALLVALALERLRKPAALASLCALAALAGWRDVTRMRVWHDELALFRDGVEHSPRSLYVRWGLGRVLLDRFRATNDAVLLFEANDQFCAAQDLSTESPPDPRVLVTAFDEIQSSLGVGWYHLLCALHVPQECTRDEAELVFRNLADKLADGAPGSAEARCGLGVSLKHLGRVDEAETELVRATKCNPRHHAAWFNLGRLQLERAHWRDALASLDRAVELAPDDVESWLSLGMAAIELDLGDRARAALGRARALAPESAAPLLQLGVMAAREQRFEVALDFFEQVLRIEGSSGPAHLFRGKALFALGRPNEALRAFSDAARWLQEPSSDPLREQQLVEAFYNAGVLQLQLSPADAVAPLEEALARDPAGRWTPGLREALEKLKSDLGRAK